MLLSFVGWAGAADLAGTWRLEMSVRSTTRIPVLKDSRTDTVTVALVTVRADGDQLVHAQLTCGVDIRDDSPLARTILPDALLASLPITTATAVTREERYVVDLGTSHLGYDPDRSRGALPADAADPAVVDVEGDGRPGATVRVKVSGVGEFGIDVVQRSRAVLDGTFDGVAIRGGVRTVDFAQRVLSADHALMRRAPDVTHDDAGSTFAMTRLPEGATCADALAAGSGSR